VLLCAFTIIGGAFATYLFQRLTLHVREGGSKESRESALKSSGSVAIVGAITSAALSVILLAVQLIIGSLNLWILVWAFLTAGSIYVCIVSVRVGMELPDLRKVLGGLSLSLLISVLSVAYTVFYLPSAVSPFLSVSVSIGKASVNNVSDTASIPISITVTNSQKVGVYLLAAYYDVSGRLGSVSVAGKSAFEGAEYRAARNLQPIRQFTAEGSYDLLQESPIGMNTPRYANTQGYFLDPGESLTVHDVATISTPTRYDAIQVSYNIALMRDDRSQLDASYGSSNKVSWNKYGGNVRAAPIWAIFEYPGASHFVYWRAPLQGDDYLTGLLRRPQVVNTVYILPPLILHRPIFLI
jgi:hypothetical protein